MSCPEGGEGGCRRENGSAEKETPFPFLSEPFHGVQRRGFSRHRRVPVQIDYFITEDVAQELTKSQTTPLIVMLKVMT
ncbi:hypothetical protein F511_41154 [Dorcoceras hygrometricum]|uniref:Uncharacterized protein n=1 Tax=Dorcoceras hygrometricum TaxID=472368 RepID=A0A2Z6ZZU2_9LAMI|nr:hypothetical protein F511_41154 [Dorcoceras hygrometricum]